MKLNIKIIIITSTAIFWLMTNNQLFQCIASQNHIIFNNYTIENSSYRPKINLIDHNHMLYPYNYNSVYPVNTIITHPYNHIYPYNFPSKSKIQLQNDSIYISHIFHNYQNIYRQMLPFVQLSIQNILSTHSISLGGGNKYLYDHQHAVGYNCFYYFPISQITNQPCIINIGGEYWYNNILFILNNFYCVNNFFNTESLRHNMLYPQIGHQIHIQTQLPIPSNITAKITLEKFLYNKKLNKNLNENLNKNYYLTLGIDYYPIPILGFNINHVLTHKKNNNTTVCKILINYQFHVPITQQINHVKTPLSSTLMYLNTTIQPFTSSITNMIKNYHFIINNALPQHYTEIIGQPGEIKIITINHEKNPESVSWDTQTLQNFQSHGGNVVLIKKHTYAIYIPYELIHQEDNQFVLSYYINDSNNQDSHNQIKKDILISINNFQQSFRSSCLQIYRDHNIPSTNVDNIYKTDLNHDNKICPSTVHEHHSSHSEKSIIEITKNKNDKPIIIDDNRTNNPSKTQQCSILLEQSEHNNSSDNKLQLPPSPPPLPLFSLSTLSSPMEKKIISEQKKQEGDISSISLKKLSSSYSLKSEQQESEINVSSSSSIANNHNNTNTIQPTSYDLCNLLLEHKKCKFKSIGTKEYMNKIENTIKNRKQKNLSELGKIFSKLHLSQSSSSIDDSCDTENSN